jgi:hypothetical protein
MKQHWNKFLHERWFFPRHLCGVHISVRLKLGVLHQTWHLTKCSVRYLAYHIKPPNLSYFSGHRCSTAAVFHIRWVWGSVRSEKSQVYNGYKNRRLDHKAYIFNLTSVVQVGVMTQLWTGWPMAQFLAIDFSFQNIIPALGSTQPPIECIWRRRGIMPHNNSVFLCVGLYVYLLVVKWFINPLALELFFLIFAHPVFKMWIMQEPNEVELWNKRHFEEKRKEIIQHF